MNRRALLKAGAAAGVTAFAPGLASAQAGPVQASPVQAGNFSPTPNGWRTFALTTTVEPNFANKAWIPLPTYSAEDWQRPGNVTWAGNAKVAERVRDPKYGAEMLRVEWPADLQKPVIEVTTQVQTSNRALTPGRGNAAPLTDEQRKLNTAPTSLLPVGGIVKETAEGVVKGKLRDVDKARALYDWVVENTFRNAKTIGCGIGDVSWMIRTGNLNGKCADLNALYVGMARSVGLPARDLYGIRVAPSAFGYRSLGAGSEVVTRAQHCRAEVWLAGSGWTPVDPADVRKVVLEEPPANLAMSDPKVVSARRGLFGSWEGNWLAFNDGHDIKLPGSNEPALPFFMYPQAEGKGGMIDPYDVDAFRYKITARELKTS